MTLGLYSEQMETEILDEMFIENAEDGITNYDIAVLTRNLFTILNDAQA